MTRLGWKLGAEGCVVIAAVLAAASIGPGGWAPMAAAPGCATGTRITGVVLPPILVRPALRVKPWRIRYEELRLDFSVAATATGVCAAQSNRGSLGVYFRPMLLDERRLANSIASAQLAVFKQGTAGTLRECDFRFVKGVSNDCLLNGRFDSKAAYAKWSTEGFKTVVLSPFRTVPGPGTGPLTFWVNLDSLKLAAEPQLIEPIVRKLEPYIHQRLVDNLPYFAWYTVIQDPGNVSILVVNSEGQTAGTMPDGRTTEDIAQARLYPSKSNPGVILQNPPDGEYEVILTGRGKGDYQLAVSSTTTPKLASQEVREGTIQERQSVAYRLILETTSDGRLEKLSQMEIVPGDLNGDGKVDCGDWEVVRASRGKKIGQVGFNAWADLNRDGVVDERDLAMLSQRLGKPCGTTDEPGFNAQAQNRKVSQWSAGTQRSHLTGSGRDPAKEKQLWRSAVTSSRGS